MLQVWIQDFWDLEVFHKLDEIYINANIDIREKNPITKYYPQWGLNLWFQVQYSPFWANLAFTCETETLGSLYSHALLILTKSSKSKNQVMHEQEFKDPLSSTCQVSSESSLLYLESEVPGSILTGV